MSYMYGRRRKPTEPAPARETPASVMNSSMPGLPNSSLLSVMKYQDAAADLSDLHAAMSAKMAALSNQIPSAEREAERVSKGVSATTPAQVRTEMGERMGADFSGVRFHADADSVARADAMGARAWTQGKDVYFGEGGFEPSVAAHELAHTVQQGAVDGVSAVSVPMGAAQMMPSSPQIAMQLHVEGGYGEGTDSYKQMLKALDSFNDLYSRRPRGAEALNLYIPLLRDAYKQITQCAKQYRKTLNYIKDRPTRRTYKNIIDTLLWNAEESVRKVEKGGNTDGQAENTNVQAENTDGQAENTNVQAENTDGQAENTNGQAENTNVQAENTDGQAENTDGQAENTNVQAENTDGQAENTNVQAENTDKKTNNRPLKLNYGNFSGKTFSGGLNTVYQFDDDGTGQNSGFYKPSIVLTPDNVNKMSANSLNSESCIVKNAKIKGAPVSKGGHDYKLATHKVKRDIAAGKLDELIGGNVIVHSQAAKISEDKPKFSNFAETLKENEKRERVQTLSNIQNSSGVLMETAKGANLNAYQWKTFVPTFNAPNLPSTSEGASDSNPSSEQTRKPAANTLAPPSDNAWVNRTHDEKTRTIQDRLSKRADYNNQFEKKEFQAWGDKKKGFDKIYQKGLTTLDTANPKFQRDMNVLFLLDTLMLHPDRSVANYKIETDKNNNYASLKGIDNDLTFGEYTDVSTEGMRDNLFLHGGLPEKMHIDRQIAESIRAVTDEQLQSTFADLLDEDEIKALQKRFEYVKKYIDKMEEEKMLVDEWNDRTAQEQLLMSEGKGQFGKGNTSSHTYYQTALLQIMDKQISAPHLYI